MDTGLDKQEVPQEHRVFVLSSRNLQVEGKRSALGTLSYR